MSASFRRVSGWLRDVAQRQSPCGLSPDGPACSEASGWYGPNMTAG
jgi:hypothetical protein